MKLVRWKRFTWDLAKLPPSESALQAHFQVRPASREDAKAAREVIFSAFSLDSMWADTLKGFSARLDHQLEAAFARPSPSVLVVTHGQRVIAASLLATEADAENHLLSGPCVLSEYRNRGIGTALLYQSLKLLQGAGLTRALGVCKETASAAKFVYPKFGSTGATYDYETVVAAPSHR